MIIITYIFLLIQYYQAFAYEFEHFRTKGALKTLNLLSRSNTDQNNGKIFIESKSAQFNLARQEVARKLLDLDEVGNLSTKSINVNVSEERYSMIFKKVKELLGSDINSIGNTETAPLIYGHQMGGGIQNFSGLSWHRPQSNFLPLKPPSISSKITSCYKKHKY